MKILFSNKWVQLLLICMTMNHFITSKLKNGKGSHTLMFHEGFQSSVATKSIHYSRVNKLLMNTRMELYSWRLKVHTRLHSFIRVPEYLWTQLQLWKIYLSTLFICLSFSLLVLQSVCWKELDLEECPIFFLCCDPKMLTRTTM